MKEFQINQFITLKLEGGKTNIKELEATFIERFKLLLKQGYLDPIEFEATRKDGKKFWLTLESSLVNLGNETLVQVFIEDITERKNNELKIKKSEEELQGFLGKADTVCENESIKLDTTPPTTESGGSGGTSPSSSSYTNESVTNFTVNASDVSGVQNVTFFVKNESGDIVYNETQDTAGASRQLSQAGRH